MAFRGGVISRGEWEAIYLHAFPAVYRALATALLDTELARDSLHEAFAAGLRHPPRHDDNIPGWLFRVALRNGRAWQRRLRRLLSLEVIGREASSTESAKALQTVLDRIEVAELLTLLNERQRIVVVAHYYLDFTQQQVAEVLGLPRGTVASTLSRALQRMRQGGVASG